MLLTEVSGHDVIKPFFQAEIKRANLLLVPVPLNASVRVLSLPPGNQTVHCSESQSGSGRVEESAPEERSNARMQATNNPDMRGTTDASDKVSHSPGLPLASNSAVCAAFQRLDSAALLHNSRGRQLQGDAGTTRPGQKYSGVNRSDEILNSKSPNAPHAAPDRPRVRGRSTSLHGLLWRMGSRPPLPDAWRPGLPALVLVANCQWSDDTLG